MAEPINLITAQVSFLEPHLALIHIPIELYSAFLQPILRLLFGEDHDEDAQKISWTNRHEFLNVTLTPVECSVICSTDLANRFFAPLVQFYQRRANGGFDNIEVGIEDYCVIQVDGQGLDAGQRVLDLTSPLAMAGISIFFITTYFCDYVLVPFRSRRAVTTALQQQGFIFSPSADAFVSQLSPSSPTMINPLVRNQFSSTNREAVPVTPPAQDILELESRTFTKLKRNGITPVVEYDLRLVNCAGNSDYTAETDERLKNDLMQVLLSTSPATMVPFSPSKLAAKENGHASKAFPKTGLGLPDVENDYFQNSCNSATPPQLVDFSTRFLSITITASDPISIFLEHRLLSRLGSSLLGAKDIEDTLVPITLDLRDLPMEATGIVCGVAGRLAKGNSMTRSARNLRIDSVRQRSISPKSEVLDFRSSVDTTVSSEQDTDQEPVEISFLSTAKAGTVLVKASQLQKAMEALDRGMCEVGR